ncbi:MAG: hypothetical protein ACOYMR_09050 [Ilumatobacteraceae bacterium]
MTRIELQLTRVQRSGSDESPSVKGSIAIEDGAATPFVGWIELLTVLEDCLQPPESTDQ